MAGFFIPLLFSLTVQATTFGPIPVVQQAEHSQYFAKGTIVGAPWVEMEPRENRPYTYWRVRVSDQQIGEPLGETIVIRQPGGEIGDMGYNVAGAANFRAGEEVFIALRSTDQANDVKEVVGLSSGKYRIEKGPNGELVVINGLGLPVTGGDGKWLSPEEFRKLLQRVGKNESTDADRNVFVNRTPTSQHAQTEMEQKREAEAAKLLATSRPDAGNTRDGSGGNSAAKNGANAENEIQKRAPSSEEQSTGSPVGVWVLAALLLLALAGTMVLILRK